MWSYISLLLGWALVFLAIAVYKLGAIVVALVALLALGTTFVLKQPAFPHRSRALAYSWFGPLVLSVAGYGIARIGTESYVLVSLVHGTLAALFMLWLWRGYGAVIPLAIGYAFPKSRSKAEQLAVSYPFRYWWALPVLVFALGAFYALALWSLPLLLHHHSSY